MERGRDDNVFASTIEEEELLSPVNGICRTKVTGAATATSDVTEQQKGRTHPVRRHTISSMNGLGTEKKATSESGGKWYSGILDKKRKALNLLGSVRRGATREKGKEEARRSAILDSIHTGREDCPRSPALLLRRTRARSRSGSEPQSLGVALRPGALQGSTGFSLRDELSTSLTVPPSFSQYGSCKDLADQEKTASIRKSNSLPRSILCSPVVSRRGRRPFSQWVTDGGDATSVSTNSSPRSLVTTPLGGSREALPSPFIPPAVVTTEESDTRGEETFTHGGTLTRSSSLPADADTLPLELLVREQNEEEGKMSVVPRGTRLALRSQSFNTHMQTLSVSSGHNQDMVSVILSTFPTPPCGYHVCSSAAGNERAGGQIPAGDGAVLHLLPVHTY